MRRLLLPVLAVGLVLGWSTSARAQDDPKEIIRKAISAYGGQEKLDKFKASKSTGKGTINIAGMEITFTIETMAQVPDKSKSVIKMEVMGMAITMEQVINGDKAKMTLNGMDVPIPDEQKAELKASIQIGRASCRERV